MSHPVALLHHDLGKRIARTARNVRGVTGTVRGSILAMLVKDLYAIDGARRASEVFEDRARELPQLATALDPARAALTRIDALEHAVRAGEAPAIDEAVGLALEIEAFTTDLLVREVAR